VSRDNCVNPPQRCVRPAINRRRPLPSPKLVNAISPRGWSGPLVGIAPDFCITRYANHPIRRPHSVGNSLRQWRGEGNTITCLLI
jgi:hypothetical protein